MLRKSLVSNVFIQSCKSEVCEEEIALALAIGCFLTSLFSSTQVFYAQVALVLTT
jgi:hypothetical protein